MDSLAQQVASSYPASGSDRTLTTQDITMQMVMSHHIDDDSVHQPREAGLQGNTAHLPFAQSTSLQKAQGTVE